jgi:hypothetical protein
MRIHTKSLSQLLEEGLAEHSYSNGTLNIAIPGISSSMMKFLDTEMEVTRVFQDCYHQSQPIYYTKEGSWLAKYVDKVTSPAIENIKLVETDYGIDVMLKDEYLYGKGSGYKRIVIVYNDGRVWYPNN